MPGIYPKERYSHPTIRRFVEMHQERLASTPLTTHQIQESALFQRASKRPEGPLDIVYYFDDEQKTPALGFQQVDGESDAEEMYTLVYLDPSLEQPWKEQVGPAL